MKKETSVFIFGIAIFAFIFLFSEEFFTGFSAGLSNCANIVIPSLFPFIAASSLIGYGKPPTILSRIVGPLTKHIFRLPPDSFPAIILGQLGGYLVGASSAASLCSSGSISRNQAQRLVLFCVNSGIGFSVNAVGNSLLGSREAGKILLLSLCISSVAVGICTRFIPEKKETTHKAIVNNIGFSSAAVMSVYNASSAMLKCCGFVCLFSGLSSTLSSIIRNPAISIASACILEVTSGCAAAVGKVSLPVIAAICAFGGLCVHMQIFSLTECIGINIPTFYFFRLLHAVLACVFCKIILYLHPIREEVFISVSNNVRLWSFSAPSAISLLLMCALLILDLDNERKIC